MTGRESGAAGADASAQAADLAAETVRVRRSPKIGRFLLVGGVLGLVVALIATLAFPPDGTYTTGQVFAYSAAVCVPVGLALFGALAVVLDARSSRRARIVAARRTAVEGAGTASSGSEPRDTERPRLP